MGSKKESSQRWEEDGQRKNNLNDAFKLNSKMYSFKALVQN